MDKDFIVLQLQAQNSAEVICQLGMLLLRKGCVKQGYIEAVLQRETKLPTGLELPNFSVAIPHTNPEHVRKAAFAVGVLAKPVPFHCMVAPDVTTDVHIVFLLAIKDPDKQVELLQKLMALFQNPSLLDGLRRAKTKEEIATKLQHISMA